MLKKIGLNGSKFEHYSVLTKSSALSEELRESGCNKLRRRSLDKARAFAKMKTRH